MGKGREQAGLCKNGVRVGQNGRQPHFIILSFFLNQEKACYKQLQFSPTKFLIINIGVPSPTKSAVKNITLKMAIQNCEYPDIIFYILQVSKLSEMQDKQLQHG